MSRALGADVRSPPSIRRGSARDRCAAPWLETLRRAVTIRRDEAAAAAAAVVDGLVREGRLVRDGDVVRRRGGVAASPDPALAAAMDRLESLLDVAAPPPLSDAARAGGCPPDGIRALERAARIVVLDADLAYAMGDLPRSRCARPVDGADAPLTPAAFRDATGTSRKYVMAILEDLDRRAILRRTPAGHVPGPKAPAADRSVPMTERIVGQSCSPGVARAGSDATSSPSRSRRRRFSITRSRRSAVAGDRRRRGRAPDADPRDAADVRLVHDRLAFEGPLAGLAAGLEAMHRPNASSWSAATCRPSCRRSCAGSSAALGDARGGGPRRRRRSRDSSPSRSRPRRGRGRRRLLRRGERRLRALLDELDVASSRRRRGAATTPTAVTLRDVDSPATSRSTVSLGRRYGRPRASARTG